MRHVAVTLFFVWSCALALGGCASQGGAPTAGPDPAAPTVAAVPMLAAASDTVGQDVSDTTDAPARPAPLQPYAPIQAMVAPPPGWQPDPLKKSRNHTHQVWLSPSGNTAYGVIRMNLPLPFIGPDTVLKPFLEEMRKTEGQATLISRRHDRKLPGIRFVAEGGQYKIRTNLITRGFHAWAIYAGTKRDAEEVPEELDQAERARERTKIGLTGSRS